MARWALLLQSYQFDVKHIRGSANLVADALSRRSYPYTSTPTDEIIDAFPDLAAISSDPDTDFSMDLSFCTEFSDLFQAVQHTPDSASSNTKHVHFSGPLATTFVYDPDQPLQHPTAACSDQATPAPSVSQTSSQDVSQSAVPSLHAVLDSTQHVVQATSTDIPTTLQPTLQAISAKPSRAQKRRQKFAAAIQQTGDDPFETLDLTPDAILDAQQNDPALQPLLDYLNNGTLPDDDQQARRLLLRAPDYMIHPDTGLLYHLFTTGNSRSSSTTAQLVIPKALQSYLLMIHHNSAFAGHVSSRKMLSVMRPRFFFIGLTRAVLDFTNSCPTCAATKKQTHKIKPPLTLQDPAEHAFHTINLDWLGPLKTSQNNNKYIVTICDQYSRYIVCFPTPDVTAKTIAKQFYQHFIVLYGCPRIVISDRGKAFISALFTELCKCYHIKQKFSSPYHAMGNALAERANRSILTVLRNYCDTQQLLWDEYLPSVAFALNTSEQYSMGMSAYLLVFGRDPVFPTEVAVPDPFPHTLTVKQQLAEILQAQEIADKVSRDKFHLVQQQMKQRYDDAHSTKVPLEPGDVVMLYSPKLQERGTKLKLQPMYHGPHIIVRFTTNVDVILKNLRTGKHLPYAINVDRLKKISIRPPAGQSLAPPRADAHANDPPQALDPLDPAQSATSTSGDVPVAQATATPITSATVPPANITPVSKHGGTDPLLQPAAQASPDPAQFLKTQLAATKNLQAPYPYYHSIDRISRCRYLPPQGLRVLVHFKDGTQDWLPLPNLNDAARKHFYDLRLPLETTNTD